MLKFNLVKIKFFILGFLSLVIGLFIYIFFRENTYVSKFVSLYVSFESIKQFFTWLDYCFFNCYFVDFLWAFSLNCWLYIIFPFENKFKLIIPLTVFAFGGAYEFLQYLNIISGTGDFVDVIFYLLAGLSVNILFLKKGIKK